VSHNPIDHEEALRRVDAQLGQRVVFGIIVRRGPGMDHDAGIVMVQGPLDTDLTQRPPRLNPSVGYYRVGPGMYGFNFVLPPMPGAIRERDSGLNFEVSEDVVIRVAWSPAPDRSPIGAEGAVFAAKDSEGSRTADVEPGGERVLEDPTPKEYWSEVIEERREEGHKVAWHGTAKNAKQAQEAAMAAFEERHGYRPRNYFSAASEQDPKSARIKARPGFGQPDE